MKLVIKRQYLYIYVVLILVFTIFYAALFVVNRTQTLDITLKQEQSSLTNVVESAIRLGNLTNMQQILHFTNYVKLLEHLYKNDTESLEFALKSTVYNFIAIVDKGGNYKSKSNKTTNLDIDKENLHKNQISTYLVFDEKNKKTYREFIYPFAYDEEDFFIVAYLDLEFLSDFDSLYLVSKDGYLLNKSSINDIDMDFNNLALFYDEWEEVISQKNGQFVSENGVFTYRLLDTIERIGNMKISQKPHYLVSIVPIDSNDSPYFINNFSSFVKYVDFKANIIYWIIGYIWILCTSIAVLIIIIGRIKNSELANLDDMTGAFNRRSGYIKIKKLISELSDKSIKRYFNPIIARFIYFRKPVHSIHFCMVDIDGLKQTNDRLGHKYGDELIITVVDCIRKGLHKSEILIRMGGDEFLIVFLNRNFNDISDYWDNISQTFIDKNNNGNFKYEIKASHGVTEYKLGMDIESCIVKADELMYEEKRRHKINLFFN